MQTDYGSCYAIVTTAPPTIISTIATTTRDDRSREPKSHPPRRIMAMFWDASANGATRFTVPLFNASRRTGNASPIMTPEGINSGKAFFVGFFQSPRNFIATKNQSVIAAATSTTAPDHHEEVSVPILK